MKKIQTLLNKYYLQIIFIISFVAVMGSLYFSDVLQIEPCYLCWWQRIFMYPLFALSASSLIFKIHLRKVHVLAIAIPGLSFAVYHWLVQTFGIGTQFLGCAAERPCTTIDVQYLGFITIPFMSMIGFLTIVLVVVFSSDIKTFVKRVLKK